MCRTVARRGIFDKIFVIYENRTLLLLKYRHDNDNIYDRHIAVVFFR